MKTVSFVRHKFNQMLAVATMTMSVNYIVMLSGSVVVGNLVGGDGLAGVNTCTPAFGIASFLASILSVGTALVFSRAMGAFDERRARAVFTQSLLLAVAMGAAIFLVMRLGGEAFLDFTGVTGAVRVQAAAYWRWQALAMGLLPAVLLMEALVYADGDVTLAAVAGALHVTGTVALSILFTRTMGDAGGASAGTALTMVIVLVACAFHFLRRDNHLKLHWRPSAHDLGETCAASLADSTIYVCWGVLIAIVNRFTVARFGQDLLPVVALAASVVEFSIVFDGIGEALIPLGGMYDGEGNSPALRELAGHAAFMATAEGVVCGAVFFVFAPVIAPLYGIRGASAPLLPEAVAAIRLLALAMPFMGFLMMANTHFLVVHHIRFAVSVTVVKDFICPMIGVLALGLAYGSRGMWAGFAAGYALAAAYPLVYVRLRHGRELFPWLISRDDGRSIDFAVRLTEWSLSDAGDRIAEFLNDAGIYEDAVVRIAAVVREMGALTMKANARAVVCEYFVSIETPGTVRLIIRDTGRSQDVNGVAGSVAAASGCRYLNTLGCNRSEYRFEVAV